MVSAAVDTNVLASGLASDDRQSPPVQIVRRWLRGEFDLVISVYILDELQRTLSKDYFRARMPADAANRWLRTFRA